MVNARIREIKGHMSMRRIQTITIPPSMNFSNICPFFRSYWCGVIRGQYVENTWVRRYDPSLWNITSINEYQISGRTKNCFERYSRRLNDLFVNANPNISSFVTVIRNEFDYYLQVWAQIRQNSTSIEYGQGIFNKTNLAGDYLIWKLNN
ncbi:hypothetical protein RF11_10863 [Thelohanellus kitauei]|uniref:Uncharacterized protein n=1 Tax=Thelohanellus kitauei TaxID=669202 RepID=A0A0C2IAB2_THEKT|nr:hypothetical protein RF11_10863 [Thelohanellus kitauei]